MAFCKYCGRELKEGEVCSCQEAQEARAAAQAAGQEAAQTAVQEAQAAGQTAAREAQTTGQTAAQEAQAVAQAAGQEAHAAGQEAQAAAQTAAQEAQTAGQEAHAAAQTAAQEAQAAGQTASQAAQQAAAGEEAAIPSLDTEKIMTVVKEVAGSFVGVFTKPATAGRTYVAKAGTVTSLCFIVIQALLSAFFGLILTAKINSAVNDLVGSIFKMTVFPGAKAFFLTLLFSLLGSALLLLLFLISTMILKVKAYWRQLVALVAVRSVAVSPLILLSWILACINPILGISVFFGSVLLALAFLLEGMKGIDGMKDNKAFYTVIIVMVIFILIYGFVFSKALPLYVSSTLRESLQQLMEDPSQLFKFF